MIYRIVSKPLAQNTYLYCLSGTQCLIIDPGLDYESIQKEIDRLQVEPIAVLCTHGHFDHIGSVAIFQEKYNCPFYIFKMDIKLCKSANFIMKACRFDYKIKTPVPDYVLTKDTSVEIGNHKVDFFYTPGHTAGSCLIKINNILFSGDTLLSKPLEDFDFPEQNNKVFAETINRIWNMFPQDMMVYPGHGKEEKYGILIKKYSEYKLNLV